MSSRTYFKSNGTNYTQKLADYAVNLKCENLPEDVIQRAKMFTLHTIGVSLAAAPIDLTKSSIDVARIANNGTGGDASVWVGGEKMSMANAAFANGTIADMLDWEDCAWTGHPSAGVIPVAMAVAEAKKKSGKEYLEAVVAGYEVYQRVAMAVQPGPGFDHNQGWALCNWQIFATWTAERWIRHSAWHVCMRRCLLICSRQLCLTHITISMVYLLRMVSWLPFVQNME